MSEEIKKINTDEAEIDFVAIGERIKGAFRYLLRKWWVVSIALVVGVFLGFGLSWWVGKKYVANAAFTVQGQSQTSSILNSAMSLASSFGLAGKSSGGGYDNNFFASLLQSRRILKKSLLESDIVDGKKAPLAQHYIHVYKWDKSIFGNPTPYSDFKFKHFDFSSLTSFEDSILTVVYTVVTNKNLVVTYDDSKSFNSVTITTYSKDLSRALLKHLIDNCSGYYVSNMYGLNNQNLSIAEHRLDSLADALKDIDSKVAAMKDNANNIIKQSGLVGLNSAIRDQSLLNIQYSSAVNNYELAKVSLISNIPILDVVDDPNFGTEVKFIPKIFAMIVGGFLLMVFTGGFLALRFVIVGDTRKEKNIGNIEA